MSVEQKGDIRQAWHRISFIAAFVALAVVNGVVTQKTFSLGNLYYAILIIALLLTFFQSAIKRLSVNMSFIPALEEVRPFCNSYGYCIAVYSIGFL